MKTRIQLPELFPSITIAHSFKKVSLLSNTDDAINVFRAGNIFTTLNGFLFFTILLSYLTLQFQICRKTLLVVTFKFLGQFFVGNIKLVTMKNIY